MRITMIVFLSIAVLAGVLAGGGLSWSLTMGPKSGDMKKAGELLSEMKQVAKADSPGLMMLEQGMRGLRVLQFGGIALALIDIALLVLVIKRNSRAVLIGSIALVALSAITFLLKAPKDVDDATYILGNTIAALALAPVLFALAADRFGRRKAGAAAAVAMG
jgi:hypothetical protein